jgi:hypothetical protein
MKNTFLILFAAIFITIPTVSFGQDTLNEVLINEPNCSITTPIGITKKKISYSFINEYGFCMGKYFEGDRGLLRKGATAVFVNGIRFNKTQDEIGIGIGIELMVFSLDYPLYFNYRHYFKTKTVLKPLINVAVGTRFLFWEEYIGGCVVVDTKLHCNFGLYSTVAAGFKVKAFSFNVGGFIRSWDPEIRSFFGGMEIKTGFTF